MDIKHLRMTALAAALVAGSAGFSFAQTTTTEPATTETAPATTAETTTTTVERNDGFDWGWLGLLGLLGLAGLGRRRERPVPVHTDTTVGRTTVR